MGNTDLPAGWRVTNLSTIGSFSKGKGIAKADLTDGGIACIRYGEIYTRHDNIIKQFYSFISQETAEKSKKIYYNNLLFAGSGETKEDIGKSVAYRLHDEAYAGGDIIILDVAESYRADYIAYFLNSVGRKQLNRLGAGDSIVHI